MRNRMEEILENEICVRYERNNGVNYAVIDTKEEWKCEDDYEVKMLMLNTPEYFLHITMNYIDKKTAYIMIFRQNSSLVSCLSMER